MSLYGTLKNQPIQPDYMPKLQPTKMNLHKPLQRSCATIHFRVNTRRCSAFRPVSRQAPVRVRFDPSLQPTQSACDTPKPSLDNRISAQSVVLSTAKGQASQSSDIELLLVNSNGADLFVNTARPILRGLVIASACGFGCEKDVEKDLAYCVKHHELFMLAVQLFANKNKSKKTTNSALNRLKSMKRWVVMKGHHKNGRVWKFAVQKERERVWKNVKEALQQQKEDLKAYGYIQGGIKYNFSKSLALDSPGLKKHLSDILVKLHQRGNA